MAGHPAALDGPDSPRRAGTNGKSGVDPLKLRTRRPDIGAPHHGGEFLVGRPGFRVACLEPLPHDHCGQRRLAFGLRVESVDAVAFDPPCE